jgi:hypothetical protein
MNDEGCPRRRCHVDEDGLTVMSACLLDPRVGTGVQAAMTGTSKQNFFGGLILNQKERWVKLKKGIII